MDYFVRLMERLRLLSSYLGDEVIKIASISRRHPDIAQEIVLVVSYIENFYKFHVFYNPLALKSL